MESKDSINAEMVNIDVCLGTKIICQYASSIIPRIGETVIAQSRWFKVYDVIYRIIDNNNDPLSLTDVILNVVELDK